MNRNLPMIQTLFSEDGDIMIGTANKDGTWYKEPGKSAFIKVDYETAIKLGIDLIAMGVMRKRLGKEGIDVMKTYINTKGK
jgi:hypothetical protein